VKLPQIVEADFGTIAAMMDSEFPTIFSDWQALCAAWQTEYQTESIQWVRVHPSTLAAYLKRTAAPPSMNELLKFIGDL
jgi:hypothetical protein